MRKLIGKNIKGGVCIPDTKYKETDMLKQTIELRRRQIEKFGHELFHDHIHIPKTGGVSVCKPLFIRNSHDTVGWRYSNYNTWDSIKTVSITIRDPWQRAISWYLYGSNWRKYSFEEWVLLGMLATWRWGKDNPRMLHQEDWFTYADKELITFWLRFENLSEDYLRLCKYLKIEDPLPLQHIHNRSENLENFPHYANYSEYKKDYTIYWTDEMRKVADPMFKVMIERFGYKFGKICEK